MKDWNLYLMYFQVLTVRGGFPGCGGLANAIVEGKAAVNACPVGGEICATKIGDIMGISSESEDRR